MEMHELETLTIDEEVKQIEKLVNEYVEKKLAELELLNSLNDSAESYVKTHQNSMTDEDHKKQMIETLHRIKQQSVICASLLSVKACIQNHEEIFKESQRILSETMDNLKAIVKSLESDDKKWYEFWK